MGFSRYWLNMADKKIKVHRRVIRMIFPMIRRAENGRSVLRALPVYDNEIVLDNFEGSGGTVTHSSGFTQPQVMLGDVPYKFSKLSNNICHRHADGNNVN